MPNFITTENKQGRPLSTGYDATLLSTHLCIQIKVFGKVITLYMRKVIMIVIVQRALFSLKGPELF